MNKRYDIAIVGGGMVGGMLACALGNSRFSVAVIEAGDAPEFEADDDYALRVSALSVASQRMLEVTGAWPGVVQRRACPYRRMLVWDSESGGETLFDSSDIAEPHLGHIVENHVLQLALIERLVEFENIDFFPQTRIEYASFSDTAVHLSFHDGRSMSASLLVGADGGNSRVRALADFDVRSELYDDQHALVSTVVTELPQQDITWQRFVPSGPEAFLPLCGHRASLVWYNTPEEVGRLKSLDTAAFTKAVEQQFPERLGGVRSLVGRGSFPLSRMHARQYVKPRVALIGDAAHTIHPLAGQGVNLGLLDAATLAEVIIDGSGSRDCGAILPLRRYERWRKGHNHMMQLAVDGFYRAFRQQPGPVQIARAGAMMIADKIAPVNQLCMRYASGISGDLPQLARGISLQGL